MLRRRLEHRAIDQLARVLPADAPEKRLEALLVGEAGVDLLHEAAVLVLPERTHHPLDLGHLGLGDGAVRLHHLLEQRHQRETLLVVQVRQFHGRHPMPPDRGCGQPG